MRSMPVCTRYHAFDTPYRGLIADKAAYEAGARASAQDETRAFTSRHLGTSAGSLNIEVGHGDAARRIAEYAGQTEVDLVLAGTHGSTGLFRVLLGSVALALIDDVPSDSHNRSKQRSPLGCGGLGGNAWFCRAIMLGGVLSVPATTDAAYGYQPGLQV
jgi:hypothetical protein